MEILCLILSVIFTSLGQVLQKKATDTPSYLKRFENHRFEVLFNHHFLFASFSLMLGTIFWMLALTKIDLSIANPILSLSYVIVMLGSKFLFHEEIPPKRWLGIVIIILGIIIISNT